MPSTESTRGCRATRIWSACCRGASSTTSVRGCGWRAAATRRTRPIRRPAGRTGLLIGPQSTFGAVGAAGDEAAFAEFYRRCRIVTSRLWPTLTAAAADRDDAVNRSSPAAIRTPTTRGGSWSTSRSGTRSPKPCRNDLVRGVMATDALIGTFARADDPSLHAERLLPVPPARWRHRRLGRAGRRHGRGQRSAGRGGGRPWRRNHHGRRGLRHRSRMVRCATAATARSTGCTPISCWPA